MDAPGLRQPQFRIVRWRGRRRIVRRWWRRRWLWRMWRMTRPPLRLGLGAGWRPELALMLERRADLGFVELLAEDFWSARRLPFAVEVLRDRGVTAVVHGVSLSLGSAERPDRDRL